MRRKILFTLICLIMIIIIGQVSYAAIEIVPSKNEEGTDAIVNTTVSNSYLLCQNMKNYGESLYGTTVVPHLATNKDWGAVSYLSNSIYGTNTTGGANGIKVTIDDVDYYSTTTNITGVMNWGSNPNKGIGTQTAGLLSVYDNSTSTISSNITEIYNNKDTKYVELIGKEYSMTGMAMSETSGFYGSKAYLWLGTAANPISIRTNLFGAVIGNDDNPSFRTCGKASANATFRPVIWNR